MTAAASHAKMALERAIEAAEAAAATLSTDAHKHFKEQEERYLRAYENWANATSRLAQRIQAGSQ